MSEEKLDVAESDAVPELEITAVSFASDRKSKPPLEQFLYSLFNGDKAYPERSLMKLKELFLEFCSGAGLSPGEMTNMETWKKRITAALGEGTITKFGTMYDTSSSNLRRVLKIKEQSPARDDLELSLQPGGVNDSDALRKSANKRKSTNGTVAPRAVKKPKPTTEFDPKQFASVLGLPKDALWSTGILAFAETGLKRTQGQEEKQAKIVEEATRRLADETSKLLLVRTEITQIQKMIETMKGIAGNGSGSNSIAVPEPIG